MPNNQDQLNYAKYKKREVSSFHAREMLLDHYLKNLDQDRDQAIQHYLDISLDAQLELKNLQSGLQCTETLSRTEVSDALVERLKQPNSYLYRLLQKSNFAHWPQGLKWGLESLMVITIISVIMTVVPWSKIIELGTGSPGAQVVIAEVKREEQVAQNEVEEKGEFIDEGISVENSKREPEVVAPVVVETTSPAKPVVAVSDSTETVKKAPAVETVAAKPETAPVEPTVTEVKKITLPEGIPQIASGGYLFRGTLQVKGLQSNGVKIKEKIISLGGRKAGDVELGWQKKNDSQYYHFTMPDAKYAELINFIHPFGKLTLRREKHPRVMPDGILRLIITVEEVGQ